MAPRARANRIFSKEDGQRRAELALLLFFAPLPFNFFIINRAAHLDATMPAATGQRRSAQHQPRGQQGQQAARAGPAAVIASGSTSSSGIRRVREEDEDDAATQEGEARAQRRARVREEAAARGGSVVDVDDLESDEDEEGSEDEDEDEEDEFAPPPARQSQGIRPPPPPDGCWERTSSVRHQVEIAGPRRHRFWTGRDWYVCACQAPTCHCGMTSSDEEQSEGEDEDEYSDEEDPYAEIDPDETWEERRARERRDGHREAAEWYRTVSKG